MEYILLHARKLPVFNYGCHCQFLAIDLKMVAIFNNALKMVALFDELLKKHSCQY